MCDYHVMVHVLVPGLLCMLCLLFSITVLCRMCGKHLGACREGERELPCSDGGSGQQETESVGSEIVTSFM